MNTPLVSVIIPTYKSRGGLQKSVDSVLAQTYKNIEVIVVDDNNPDSPERFMTQNQMQKYATNPKVLYLKHLVNRNGAAARNTGIKAANGIYIAFLDDDDTWLENKLEKQVAYLQQHADLDASYTFTVTGNKQPWAIPFEGNAIIPLLMSRARMYTSTLLMTKSSIDIIGGFDESFRRHQDFELLIKFFDNGFKIGCLQEVLTCYTPLGGNVPSPEKFVELKDKYLSVFDSVLNKLDSQHHGLKKKIIVANYSVVFYVCISCKAYKTAMLVFNKYFWLKPSTFIGQIFFMLTGKIRRRTINILQSNGGCKE